MLAMNNISEVFKEIEALGKNAKGGTLADDEKADLEPMLQKVRAMVLEWNELLQCDYKVEGDFWMEK